MCNPNTGMVAIIIRELNQFQVIIPTPLKVNNTCSKHVFKGLNGALFLSIPLSINFDRGDQFTSHFWRSFQKSLDTKVKLNTAFHPQMDGQVEHTIKTLRDILRACVIDFKGSWGDHLPLIEFSYNNSYHSSIGMTPFEALYGRRCRSPVGWFEVGDFYILVPNIIHEAVEKVRISGIE